VRWSRKRRAIRRRPPLAVSTFSAHTESSNWGYLAANPGTVIEAVDKMDGTETRFDVADEVNLED